MGSARPPAPVDVDLTEPVKPSAEHCQLEGRRHPSYLDRHGRVLVVPNHPPKHPSTWGILS